MEQPAPDPQLILPRGLIVVSSLWLVVSWTATIGFRAPVEASSASYTPGVRIMLISSAIGLIIAWPLLRLSQAPVRYPIQQTLLDLAVLLSLLQVVVWPLRLVTPWTPGRTAAVDATLAAWAILAGAFVASAVGSRRAGPRNLAMIGCVGLGLVGPLATLAGMALPVVGDLSPNLMRIGPLLEVHALGQGGGTSPGPDRWTWILLVGMAAGAAWGGVSAALLLRARRHGRGAAA